MTMDELTVTKLEMVEERSSGDDDEAEEAEDGESVRLRNKSANWRPITHETITMKRS